MTDLATLFARDPLKLTKEDRTEIIAYYRQMREVYMAGGKKVKAEPPKEKLNLDDLDLS